MSTHPTTPMTLAFQHELLWISSCAYLFFVCIYVYVSRFSESRQTEKSLCCGGGRHNCCRTLLWFVAITHVIALLYNCILNITIPYALLTSLLICGFQIGDIATLPSLMRYSKHSFCGDSVWRILASLHSDDPLYRHVGKKFLLHQLPFFCFSNCFQSSYTHKMFIELF